MSRRAKLSQVAQKGNTFVASFFDLNAKTKNPKKQPFSFRFTENQDFAFSESILVQYTQKTLTNRYQSKDLSKTKNWQNAVAFSTGTGKDAQIFGATAHSVRNSSVAGPYYNIFFWTSKVFFTVHKCLRTPLVEFYYRRTSIFDFGWPWSWLFSDYFAS